MKRSLTILFAGIVALGCLTGCSGKDTVDTNTVYHAEYANPVHGYIPFVDLTVDANKKITSITYNWKKEDDSSALKSDDEEYAKTWRSVNPDMDQNVARENLMNQLQEKQDISKVDTVAGATMASSEFKELVSKLMKERVQKGNKKELVIDNSTSST